MFPRRGCLHLRQFRFLPMKCLRGANTGFFCFVSVRFGQQQCPRLRSYVIFRKGLLAETRHHCIVLLCALHGTVLLLSILPLDIAIDIATRIAIDIATR